MYVYASLYFSYKTFVSFWWAYHAVLEKVPSALGKVILYKLRLSLPPPYAFSLSLPPSLARALSLARSLALSMYIYICARYVLQSE